MIAVASGSLKSDLLQYWDWLGLAGKEGLSLHNH